MKKKCQIDVFRGKLSMDGSLLLIMYTSVYSSLHLFPALISSENDVVGTLLFSL